MDNLLKETERLRLVYLSEMKKRQDQLYECIAKMNAKIDDALKADVAKEYIETYETSLSALEKIYAAWDDAQRNATCLNIIRISDTRVCAYPRPVPKGGVLPYVDRLVEDAKKAITEVNQSKTPEDDETPMMRFCQALVDLLYVVDHARPLLEASAELREAKEAKVKELKAQKADKVARLEEGMKLENLDCYKDLSKLRNELSRAAGKADEAKIGRSFPDGGTDWRFLIGFQKNDDLSKETISFVEDILHSPTSGLMSAPVYFEPKARSKPIVIRANQDYFDAVGGDEQMLIMKIYLSLLSSLGPKNLRLAGAETALESVVGALGELVKGKLGEAALYDKKIASTPDEALALNESLFNLMRSRSTDYNMNGCRSIYEYNESVPDAKHDLVLAVYNYAPDCFGDRFTAEKAKKFSEILKSGPAKGILPIVRVDSDSDFPLTVPCEEIVIENGEVSFNGRKISPDILVKGFKIGDYLGSLSKQSESADSLSLKKLLEQADEDFKRNPIENYNKALRIPLGISSAGRYDYLLKTCSPEVNGLIVGTIGSGKSSFLHTLILSAAHCYAPDELQFYLVDFKSKETSPAFANYAKGNPLYLPHVVYLSLRCREESAMDLLNKMQYMKNQRSKMMDESKTGCSDIIAFNRSEAVTSGRYPKIPIAMFIIDEYNNMFNTAGGVLAENKFSAKLAEILRTGRSYGIYVLLCGQNAEPLRSSAGNDGAPIEQINSRFALKVNKPDVFRSLFGIDTLSADDYAKKLQPQGTVLISVGVGANPTLVKVAYAGDTDKQDIKDIAASIREKYKNNHAAKEARQTIAGDDSLFPISEYRSVSYNEGPFDLPIGASAANKIGVALSFAEDRNATGYSALSNDIPKLFELERCLALSFIDKIKDGFPGGRFIYAAGPADGEEFLEGFEREQDFVSRHIEMCDDPDYLKIAKELTSLSSLLEERRKKKKQVKDPKFDPVYLLIHDVEWLLGKGSIGGASSSFESEGSSEDSSLAKSLAGSGVSLKGAAASMLGRKLGMPSSAGERKQSSQSYYISDLREIVSDLYENGSGYCIFLILAHDKPSGLETVQGEGDNAKNSERCVYDSYETLKALSEKRSIEKKDQKDPACVYDRMSSTRTRLFDYSSSKNASWWKQLKEKRK